MKWLLLLLILIPVMFLLVPLISTALTDEEINNLWNNLTLYNRLDDPAGGNDSSIYENDGTVFSGTSKTSGCVVGDCRTFANADNYIIHAFIPVYKYRSFTVVVWMDGTTQSSGGMIGTSDIYIDHMWEFGTQTASRIVGNVYSGAISLVPDDLYKYTGEWNQIAFVVDDDLSNGSLILNASIVRSDSILEALTGTTNDIYIGEIQESIDGALNRGYVGNLDEIMVFNRDLSVEEIKYLYDEAVAGRHFRNVTIILDTCTAPGSGDWNIDCSDNCVLDSAQDVVADMHLNGAGTIVLSAPLTFTGSDSILSVASGCTLDIRSGGEIGGQ